MKKYEKPTVEIFLLSGNETICGGCVNKLCDDETLNGEIAWLINDADGVLTKEEASSLFGPEDSCAVEINGYCKFTGTANSISWS